VREALAWRKWKYHGELTLIERRSESARLATDRLGRRAYTVERIFLNPSPVTGTMMTRYRLLTEAEMDCPSHVGGGIVGVVIIACGGKLGSYTIVTTGTVITTVVH
jgi:hypothetical protein